MQVWRSILTFEYGNSPHVDVKGTTRLLIGELMRYRSRKRNAIVDEVHAADLHQDTRLLGQPAEVEVSQLGLLSIRRRERQGVKSNESRGGSTAREDSAEHEMQDARWRTC